MSYMYAVQGLVKAEVLTGKESLVDAVYKLAHASVAAMAKMASGNGADARALREALAAGRDVAGTGPLKAIADSNRLLLAETCCLYQGTRLELPDADFANMLMTAELEALVADAKLPYPFFEIVVPAGVKLPSGTPFNGCIVSTLDKSLPGLLCRDQSDRDRMTALLFKGLGETDMHSAAVISTQLVNSVANDVATGAHTWVHFELGTEKPLDGITTALGAADSEDIKAVVRFALALCLYLQTPGSGVLDTAPGRGVVVRGMCPEAIRRLKKMPRKTVLDAPIRESVRCIDTTHGAAGTSEYRTEVRWRKLHMRALRHEKFERNKDGTVRIILVRPTLASVRVRAESEGVPTKLVRGVNAYEFNGVLQALPGTKQ